MPHEHKECCEGHVSHAQEKEEKKENKNEKGWFWPASVAFSSLLIAGAWVYTARFKNASQQNKPGATASVADRSIVEDGIAIDQEEVLPTQGVELPIVWGDIGKRLADAGVIDLQKFEALYVQRGGLSTDMASLLRTADNGKIRITPENAQVLLNIAWALGLGNKNEILEKGPMSDPQYGGAANFASTGGWTLAKGDAMQHYSKHAFITLSPDQQALVEKTAKGIYRPCCNSVHFPDCNHGMAMLGLLELMASQGVGEEEMMRAALAINSYWFPDTYLTIAKFAIINLGS